MRLTAKEHPEAVKRYRHVKPARGFKVVLCSEQCPGTTANCTLEKSHRGPHVAHGGFGKILAVWDAGAEVRPSPEAAIRPIEARAGGGLRADEDIGALLKEAWSQAVRAIGSFEELAMIVLFLLFVGFGIYWLILMMGG